MQTALDTALSNIAASEATLTADTSNLSNIDASIAQAQSPRPAAAALVATDITAFNTALDAGIAALTAAKIPVVVATA